MSPADSGSPQATRRPARPHVPSNARGQDPLARARQVRVRQRVPTLLLVQPAPRGNAPPSRASAPRLPGNGRQVPRASVRPSRASVRPALQDNDPPKVVPDW